VAEAVTNAIEHGNQLQANLRVSVGLKLRETALVIDVVDQGRRPIPALPQEYHDRPDHRGWGMLLMKNLMDEVEVLATPGRNEVRLVAYLEN
jgi:serine/threonine-protein kinase RsbW